VRFAQQVLALDRQTAAADQLARLAALRDTRASMAKQGLAEQLIAQSMLWMGRACAEHLNLRPYATQIAAACIMLDGKLAEMATGEGKTIAAALAAATAALSGIPVHLITANDYLVERDVRLLEPVYRALGLTVGYVTGAMNGAQRRQAYGCDIVYCTARELAFDYLRDCLVRNEARDDTPLPGSAGRQTLLRGLCFAIVDEADTILIDEARMPLVLAESAANDGQLGYLADALRLAGTLQSERDFLLDPAAKLAELTVTGKAKLEALSADLQAAWRNRLHREETVASALAALHLFARDRDYLVRNREIVIIDSTTGRAAPGRAWSRGLHQLIALKEACPLQPETLTRAQITYQRFFRRYMRLGAMSGTATESRAELAAVYGMPVVPVPLRIASRRLTLPTIVFGNRRALWNAALREAIELRASGRAVLIGTETVADSEQLSQILKRYGIDHAVLNARQNQAEADVVARAGRPGGITVATSMAGRGTDIRLDAEVARRGGLHVICCQHNPSRRIDRQLLGRCARQGDPGSVRTMMALDQPLAAGLFPLWIRRCIGERGWQHPQWAVRLLLRLPQWMAEQRHRRERRRLLKFDQHAHDELRFGRPVE
jgi:preprotein translocase subunit SecA